MKTLKFRAFCDVDTLEGDGIEEMVYFSKCECDNGLWFNPPGHIHHINQYLSPFEQFTGHQDKNGKDIYEGGIIPMKFENDGYSGIRYGNEYTLNGVVKYNPHQLRYIIEFAENKQGIASCEFGWGAMTALEVIGNIHQK